MPITLKEIAKMLDHSTLQPFLTEADIRKGCDIALQYDTATVCARPGDMPLVVRVLACRQAGASRCGVSATAKIMEEAINRQKTGALTESPAAPAETAGGSY